MERPTLTPSLQANEKLSADKIALATEISSVARAAGAAAADIAASNANSCIDTAEATAIGTVVALAAMKSKS